MRGTGEEESRKAMTVSQSLLELNVAVSTKLQSQCIRIKHLCRIIQLLLDIRLN